MDGIEERKEDFGQTLAQWGWKDSAYLVLPFFGPSTLRDTGGLVVDSALFDPIGYVEGPADRNQILLTKFVDRRASYLPGSDLLDEAALDPYAFMRDAYMQRRNSQIYDGNVPEQDTGAELEETKTIASAAAAKVCSRFLYCHSIVPTRTGNKYRTVGFVSAAKANIDKLK